jgi:hypothetical protein
MGRVGEFVAGVLHCVVIPPTDDVTTKYTKGTKDHEVGGWVGNLGLMVRGGVLR